MKVIAFGASNSVQSINKKLATYTANLFENADIEVLDLNDFEMPIYSADREAASGQPQQASDFLAKIDSADRLIISFAEHNGSFTAAYKNTFDWASRLRQKVFESKSVILLSTSPGPGGAKNVLAAAQGSMPFFGATVIDALSVPSFFDAFDIESNRIKDEAIANNLKAIVAKAS